ncbi:MAG: hypothetical protein GKR92_02135 [Gammaproteobacteria bacterium]|nr:MAG: hypothetical protein GKR92_02135 [Gammaproteobacteria bacterium]
MKYSGVGLFKHVFENLNKITKYKERVVMTEASSLKEAEQVILKEFKDYAIDGVEYLELYKVEEMYPEERPVTEIASTLKVFAGSDKEYIEKFWNGQRPYSCEDVGWSHVWYKKSEGISSCYNCREERDGELWQ